MYDNALTAIASQTMGDNILFESSEPPSFSPNRNSPAAEDNKLDNSNNRQILTHPQEALEEQSAGTPCYTPNTIPDTDATSPKQHIRRTSGRRPLSLLSNSSLNSNPDLYPPLDTRSPDPWSPGRHRRHRSVIGTSVDYRTYQSPYGTNPYGGTPYGAPAACGPVLYGAPAQGAPTYAAPAYGAPVYGAPAYGAAPYTTTPYGGSSHPSHAYPTGGVPSGRGSPGLFGGSSFGPSPPHHHPHHHHNNHSHNYNYNYQHQQQQAQDPYVHHSGVTSPLIPSAPFGVAASPALGPPLGGNAPSFGGGASMNAPLISPIGESVQQSGLEDVFVVLAYKERQVLEAKQTLAQAKGDLENFRRHMSAMLQPNLVAVPAPIRPSIISRRRHIGLNALQLTPVVASGRNEMPARVVSWQVDLDNHSNNRDEFYSGEDLMDQRNDGIALSVIKCLLGIVRCIITTLPVQQQSLYFQQSRRGAVVGWKAQYPMPMESMFGHLYES